MNLKKEIVKDLNNKVQKLSFTNVTRNDILRKIKDIYYENVSLKEISYGTYLEIAVYLVLYKSLQTNYQIR